MRKIAWLLAILAGCGGGDDLDDDGGKADRGGRCARPVPGIAGAREVEIAFTLPGEPWGKPLLAITEYMESQLRGTDFDERYTRERYPEIAAAFQKALPESFAALAGELRLDARLEIGARRETCDYDARLVVQAPGGGEIVVDDVRVAGDFRSGQIDILPFSLPLDLGALFADRVPCYDAPSLPSILVETLPVPGEFDSLNAACPEAVSVVAERLGQTVTLELSGTAVVDGAQVRDERWEFLGP